MTGDRRRVLVTTVPFGQIDSRPLAMLEGAGVETVINPIGRRLTEAELAAMIGPFDVLIGGTEPITAAVMAAAPRLRCIVRVGIGLDNVDLSEARRRGIPVGYTPDAPSPAVAEFTIGLMLSLLRDIVGADRRMRLGEWRRMQGRRLSESVVGLIGVGRIGRRVARHLREGFAGVRILANDIAPDATLTAPLDIVWTSKEDIYRQADVVSLHLPLSPQTRGLIGAEEFGLMSPRTFIVNTSRGGIVREAELASALRTGRIAGAAVDVFEREPYDGELTGVAECLLTSHMGSMSEDCRVRMEVEAVEEVVRFLRDEPLTRPVPESEYTLSEMMK